MKKITMMDNLTLYVNKNEYKIEIDEKFTRLTTLDEIEDLEHSVPGFFDVESISRQNNKIFLVYNLPDGYQPFENAKKYVPVIKLQLIKNLLDNDPLLESDGMTYLDPNNVFFKNFNDIKVLYRSNGLLPYHQGLDPLEQYKMFVMGFFSEKYSYKRYLVNKDDLLKKENNEFLFAVNAALSFADLRTLVDRELEKEQINFYAKVQNDVISRKKGFKKKLYLTGLVTLVACLLFLAGIEQVKKNVAAEYEQKIAATNRDNELTLALASGDTEKAIKLMKEKHEGTKAIAKMLLKAGKYNEAIAYDPGIEKDVVNRLYQIGQKEKVLDLKSNSEFITTEKEIVEYDQDALEAKIPLITQKDTLMRVGIAFIEHENYQDAKDAFERLESDPDGNFSLSENEKAKVKQYIKKSELEIKVSDLNEQILNLQEMASFDESKTDQAKREEKINQLKDQLKELQIEIVKLDEKLGMSA